MPLWWSPIEHAAANQTVSPFHRFDTRCRGDEFAAILPVLLLMLLATFDGGNAIAVYMKVRAATYVLASVTNQYSTAMPIQSSNMTGIMSATTAVLAPYSGTPVVAVISELKITAAKAPPLRCAGALHRMARLWRLDLL